MNSWKATIRMYTLIFSFSLSTFLLPQLSIASDYYSQKIQESFYQLQQTHKYSFENNLKPLSLLASKKLNQLTRQFTSQLAELFTLPNQANCEKEDTPCFVSLKKKYRQARQLLFGQLHLKGHSNKTYAIEDIYCSKTFTNKDFPKKTNLGPNQIPDHKILNTEHIWPQSRFSQNFPQVTQLTDLHILYPSHAPTNSQRGNHLFGEIQKSTSKSCGTAKIGTSKQGSGINFEPPHNYKGNVARAMFYFSLRYNLPISKQRQNMFKHWSQLDPVDKFEKNRNEAIFQFNKTRNPFIDQPESILYISESWGQ